MRGAASSRDPGRGQSSPAGARSRRRRTGAAPAAHCAAHARKRVRAPARSAAAPRPRSLARLPRVRAARAHRRPRLQRRAPPDGVVAAHQSSPARSSSERISSRSRSATCSAIRDCAHAGRRHSRTHGRLALDPRPLPSGQLAGVTRRQTRRGPHDLAVEQGHGKPVDTGNQLGDHLVPSWVCVEPRRLAGLCLCRDTVTARRSLTTSGPRPRSERVTGVLEKTVVRSRRSASARALERAGRWLQGLVSVSTGTATTPLR